MGPRKDGQGLSADRCGKWEVSENPSFTAMPTISEAQVLCGLPLSVKPYDQRWAVFQEVSYEDPVGSGSPTPS